VDESIEKALECRELLSESTGDLEMFDRRSANLSHRLYLEVLQCRMRPFGDGVGGFPAWCATSPAPRQTGPVEITGENTRVDRDILDKLETPLTHRCATRWIMAVKPRRSASWRAS